MPERFLNHPAIYDSHTGIAIFDAGTGKYLYTHNSDKYFVPASNIKLATLYAGLQYMGEAIPGIKYLEYNDTMFLKATGDPTLLLKDQKNQIVLEFLKDTQKPMVFIEPGWETGAFGYGWPWNFYLDYYMAERSPFPIYGNGIHWAQREVPGLGEDAMISYILSYPGIPWPVEIRDSNNINLTITRGQSLNDYKVYPGLAGERDVFVPFVTNGMNAALELLRDTLHKDVGIISSRSDLAGPFHTIYSHPSDSLFRHMMHFSDNFFAEQTLLMISQELFGVMDEKLLIDFLLKHDLNGLPQKPRWVDGSGLSRYNLISPRSVIWLMEKMMNDFGTDRLKTLLPTGGEGTLENYYGGEHEQIFAKTGTLDGNVVALSGFLITDRNRELIFSVLVNNHNKNSAEVRIAVENFLREIIRRY